MNRWLGTFVVLLLLAPVVAVATPSWVDEFEVWVTQTDARLDDLETRVAALETAPTTMITAAPIVLNLTSDLIVDGTAHTFSGHIEGNGFQILVKNGGSLDWDGFTVNNVRRIIHIDGCGVSTLRNGTISNSGSPNLGDYPLHWHLCGDATRGTSVENVTVVNGQHHAFVPHGSNGISFLNSTVIDTTGAAFWWDPPGSNEACLFRKFCTVDNSNDILVDGMVVDGVTNGPSDDRGFRLAAYVLGAGSGNVIRNSIARNVQPSHVKDCSGFHWPGFANQNVGGNVWVFENNRSESSECHGIFVWQNDSNLHIISGFTGVGLNDSGGGIDHGAYGNNYDYRNVGVPYLEVHAVGWKMSDSTVGDVFLQKHAFAGVVEFTNVIMDSLTVQDGAGANGIDLIVNGTNLTCGDVIWTNPHPDTRVFIDGSEC